MSTDLNMTGEYKGTVPINKEKDITCWEKNTDMQIVSVSEKQKPRWSIKIMKSFIFTTNRINSN